MGTSTIALQKSWGLVLSGGAAYGIANAGVIEALEEQNLKPTCIAGSSMGALVAGLYAMGHSSEVLRTLIDQLKPFSVASISKPPLKGGLHGGLLQHQVEKHLRPLLGDACIGDCKIPFLCVAGKIAKPVDWKRILRPGFAAHLAECMQTYVFPPETKLIDALRASSAIPVLFSPVTVGSQEFIDLCEFGAIPAKELKEAMHPDVLIATDTMPTYESIEPFLPKGWRNFLEEGHKAIEESLSICDLVIRPKLKGGAFRFDKAASYRDAGKKATEENLSALRSLLGAH